MFTSAIYQSRRAKLAQQIKSGLLYFPGNTEVGKNYSANPFAFRQDSTFLYYFGVNQPNLHAILDTATGATTLFGLDPTTESVVWTGPAPTVASLAEQVGIEHAAALADLPAALQKTDEIHYLPFYRGDLQLAFAKWTKRDPHTINEGVSEALIRAVVAQRSIKTPEEIDQMERAVTISGAMHRAVMEAAAPGKREQELAGLAEGIALGMGCQTAYPIILSKRGEVLHNHHHDNILQAGDLLLFDMGAEVASGYAGDITRTCPVAKKFTQQQREIYELVLQTEESAIASLGPGIAYQEVHLKASRQIAEGLKALGLMKGNTDEAVAAGAHALFFPHGLGHMIGLDVHDMEGLGEDFVGYDEEIQRIDQFGTAYLRLGKRLETGHVLTVEPGIYFIPTLIDQWRSEQKFTDFINYEALAKYRDFGGVRIEDNILITENGHRVLGLPIPKTVEEVEALGK